MLPALLVSPQADVFSGVDVAKRCAAARGASIEPESILATRHDRDDLIAAFRLIARNAFEFHAHIRTVCRLGFTSWKRDATSECWVIAITVVREWELAVDITAEWRAG